MVRLSNTCGESSTNPKWAIVIAAYKHLVCLSQAFGVENMVPYQHSKYKVNTESSPSAAMEAQLD